MRHVLIVGERYNVGRRWPRMDEALARGDYARWLEVSLRAGCYRQRCGAAVKKLEAVGLRPALDRGRCMNLLPPGGPSEWDAAEARAVAAAWRDWLFDRDMAGPLATRVVLLGRRVADAVLGYPCEFLTTHVMSHEDGFSAELLSLPHPSGLSRWWNDGENWDRAADAVEEFLDTSRDSATVFSGNSRKTCD